MSVLRTSRVDFVFISARAGEGLGEKEEEARVLREKVLEAVL